MISRQAAWFCVAIAITWFGAIDKVAAEQCLAAQARYQMIHDAGWTAGFAPISKQADWIRDTAFFVKSQQSGRIYWFLADQGSSGYIYLYSTRDVMQPGWKARGPDSPDDGPLLSRIDNSFMSADQDLNFLHSFPRQTDPAPEYILLPDLPSIMRMQHDYEGGPRLDFFKLIACDK